MPEQNFSDRYVRYNYTTQSLTVVPLDGQPVYFDSVITGQVKPVHMMGDGSSQLSQLPFVETLEIHSASNVDIESLRITGNRVKIYNSGSAAITVQTGITGSLTYENINAKCTSVAFFDGTYWRVEDGQQIGDLKPWHKNFGAGTQSLPWGWVAMDGSTISDPESPFNGQTLEDLNGDGRFVRGSATSGTEQTDAMQKHTAKFDISNTYIDTNGDIILVSGTAGSDAGVSAAGSRTFSSQNPINFDGIKAHDGGGTPRTADETRPINMSVVWIIKIK